MLQKRQDDESAFVTELWTLTKSRLSSEHKILRAGRHYYFGHIEV
jgi:hypothetical protein